MIRGYDRRESALLMAFVLALLSLSGAWFSELVLGLLPCKLCLVQRWPYYIGIPLLMIGAFLAKTEHGTGAARIFALLAGLTFLVSIGLGVYHSGVEWGWWAGPADCGGKIASGPALVEDFRKALEKAKVIRCDEAAGRVLGLSFAGWNVIISALIAVLALRGISEKA